MGSEEVEKILTTKSRPADGHAISKTDKSNAAQSDKNSAKNEDDKGIINRLGVTVKSDLDENEVEEEEDDENHSCYDEIDQIYDYVRGFAPLPEKLRPRNNSHKDSLGSHASPPEPPPIETIPSLGYGNHLHGVPHHPLLLPAHNPSAYPSAHHSSGYRRLSYPTVFLKILPKMGLYGKKVVPPPEHIYEKVPLNSSSNFHQRPEKRYHSGNLRARDYHAHQQTSSHQHAPRIPMRSNSTGKMYLPLNGMPVHSHPHPQQQLQQSSNPLHSPQHPHALVKPKLFIKSNQPPTSAFHNGLPINLNLSTAAGHHVHQGNRKTSKLMRYAKGLSLGNENSIPFYCVNNNNTNENEKDIYRNSINNNYHGSNNNNNMLNMKLNDDNNNKWTFRSSRSLTTSPLFNIRYKSLTNLHFITPLTSSPSSKGCYDHQSSNTLASSNSSGGKISSGSGRSIESPSDNITKAKKTRKLSRPLSFSNLFWDLKNDLTSSTSSKGCYDHQSNTLASSDSSGGKLSSGSGRSVESPSDNITKAKKTRKLSRPLSFSNLFWDLKNDLTSSNHHNSTNNSIESMCPDPRISSSPNGGEQSAMILTQLVNNVASNRRVGTLYL